MKKQLHKIKIAAENFSRPAKPDKNSEELLAADRQVDKYKEVLDKISKKFVQNPSNSSNSNNACIEQDPVALEKRCKKVHEYKLAQAMEESVRELPECLLRDVLDNCAKLERTIAMEIVNNEINVENEVTRRLSLILENHVTTIQKQKRLVTKLMQDNESAKHKYQAALRINENATKINLLREEQEECESKLEKERDIWAAEMFDLIAEERNMASYIISYIQFQKLYYKSALDEIEGVMQRVQGLINGNNRKLYKVSLNDHLAVTNRTISFVIELCVCCLLEKGMYEEGLLRVGCAGSKLRRFRSAFDANLVSIPFPSEYSDVHVIACALKSYLRDLPDPLLTFALYDEFIAAVQQPTEERRKAAIMQTIKRLPADHYANLRYLTKFLELLAQKQKYNKMSPQNIAIVMSPNLLWAPDAPDADYMQKVNSTAAVNAIVEAIVSDWSYFFHDEFTINDFYVSFTRDDLFPDNGGFSIHREGETALSVGDGANMMTKSMHAGISGSHTSVHGPAAMLSADYQTHSRSSSHDTSLILLGNNHDDGTPAKRSQSNSSLSDSSPPQQNSPKLPVRRKHNKQVAPTPPDNRYSCHPAGGYSLARSMTESKERFFRGFNADDDGSHGTAGGTFLARPTLQMNKQRTGSSENLFAKPEKPPRPAMPSIESQTLVRNAFKAKGLDKHGKPVAMPRSLLHVARSTENLSTTPSLMHSPGKDFGPNCSDSGDELEPILLRENYQPGEKPAIPERPSSLIRSSYRAPVVLDKFDLQSSEHGNGVKKAQSFRMSGGSGSPSTNSQKAFAASSPGRSQTTLERTHIYNVDKQQVEIIDVSDSNGGNGKTAATPVKTAVSATASAPATLPDPTKAEDDTKTCEKSTVVRELPTSSSLEVASTHEGIPPPSPQSKLIKRPQIPAPPPPKAVAANATDVTDMPTMATAATDTIAVSATSVCASNVPLPPNSPPASASGC